MPSATITAAWKDDTTAYATALVAEGGKRGNVEYNASTPLLDGQGNAKSNVTLKSDLVAALKSQRDAQTVTTTLLAISGTITI